MTKTEYKEILEVSQKKLFSVVTQYEEYPNFVDGCSAVKVERKGPNQARVFYKVNLMSKEIHYVLEHREDPETGKVEWDLVESNFFKKNSGSWEMKAAGPDRTDVCYSIDVEFNIPVPGFILNRLVKGSLPGMVKSFGKKAAQA